MRSAAEWAEGGRGRKRLTGCPGDAAAAAGVPKPVLAGAAPNADPGVPKGDAAPDPGVPNAGELDAAAPNAGVLAAPKPPKEGVLAAAAPKAGVLATAPNAGVLVAPKAPKAGALCAAPKAGCRKCRRVWGGMWQTGEQEG